MMALAIVLKPLIFRLTRAAFMAKSTRITSRPRVFPASDRCV
jgi:hypothetical protein